MGAETGGVGDLSWRDEPLILGGLWAQGQEGPSRMETHMSQSAGARTRKGHE